MPSLDRRRLSRNAAKETGMKRKCREDIYTLVARNRLRLAAVFSLFSALFLALSGMGVYLIHRLMRLRSGFWPVLLLFWLAYLLFAVLYYGLGGRWILRRVATLPPWRTDRNLEDALTASKLGAGLWKRIRLLEIPHPDINSFSVSLPDGSYAVFVTRGVAEKLPPREREAVLAHEVSHILAGDTAFQSVLLRLVGPGDLAHLHAAAASSGPGTKLPLALLLGLAVMISLAVRGNANPSMATYLAAVLLLFALLASALPFLMHRLMRLFLDREREYLADLQASFITRDPEAMYLALKHAAEDVRDVLVLPSNLDAVLFHPVVDFTSFRPFRTQPTMADRMRRLRESFPELRF